VARVTLTDVAKDAGVSRATASMVLNDSPLIAQATKERVRESFARLGYVYDRAAASLRKNQSLAVGLVITQLSNPYFAEFVEGIQSELDDRGMDVLLGISAEDRARQRRVLVSMSERRVDGVVVIPAHQSEPADFAGLHMPIVMLARRVKGFETDYVGGDNYTGSVAATNHLLVTHGARRPAFIGGHVYSSAREERLGGFLSAAGVLGIKVPVRNQPACVPDRVVARNVAAELILRRRRRRRRYGSAGRPRYPCDRIRRRQRRRARTARPGERVRAGRIRRAPGRAVIAEANQWIRRGT
jgi:DNA-binding LacI/PurR family transcriptional regulator